jgi:hypothetical protein
MMDCSPSASSEIIVVYDTRQSSHKNTMAYCRWHCGCTLRLTAECLDRLLDCDWLIGTLQFCTTSMWEALLVLNSCSAQTFVLCSYFTLCATLLRILAWKWIEVKCWVWWSFSHSRSDVWERDERYGCLDGVEVIYIKILTFDDKLYTYIECL